ncbi:Hypothetical protein, putative [Bodo saltans]|uniref:Uncharacterized protein n=1 Tax=Bodo saltans TaxID=75058 RepID=A0A0S4JKE6_BODSA|nr:Hypothetical protein, putative [Bodo saltans]|eukprot:CUG90850.1 Hypothetical protein, putative [Bodo saltans]
MSKKDSDELFTRVVVCGDKCSEPRGLTAALEAAARSALAGSTSVLRFESWTTPPSTLVTNVDVVILCASLCHPLSFLHAMDHWAPLFAHLPYVRVVLAVTRFELSVSPSVRAALNASDVQPVERGDIFGAVRDIAMQYHDATVTYCAVTLNVPVSGWVGQQDALHVKGSDAESHRSSASVRELLRACVEDDAFFQEDRAADQWRKTVEDVERDMDERAVLSEWMQVSYGFFVGQHRAAAEMTPVYVSRSSHGVNLTMPSQLVQRKLVEEQAEYELRCKTLLDNTPETYLLRKAAADADRRRAVDRSARRSVVLDPVLQMHERQSVLQREVKQLQVVRDRLLATSRENVEKRQRQRDLQEQLRASRVIIDQEQSEIETHRLHLHNAHALIDKLEEEERVMKRIEEELAEKVHQREIDLSIEGYRSQWAANKERRTQRDDIEKRLAEVVAATAEVQQLLSQLSLEGDMLGHRIDEHLTAMNTAQDELLLLEGHVLRLQQQPLLDTRTSGGSAATREDSLWLASEYFSQQVGLSDVVVRLETTRRRLYQCVMHPLMAHCDVELGPLELNALRLALHLKGADSHDSTRKAFLTDVMRNEGTVRLSLRIAEAHQRATLAVDLYHQSIESASTALCALAEKLCPQRLRTMI